jgi:hypothetical protein
LQTSLYGASKVAGESLIQAYCEGFGFEGYIFRFVSILGERYTHGHVFDFYRQLLEHPDRLTVLGDGTQRKSYLYIQDCLSAILHVMNLGTAREVKHRSQVYNLGSPEYCCVTESIGWICEHLGLKPKLEFTGGGRGWVGDNPFIFLDTAKIEETGWRAQMTIRDRYHPHARVVAGKPMGAGKTMKVVVVGLWHLGCVTVACCAEHFRVVGLDFDAETIAHLNSGRAPIIEPGLDELIQRGLESRQLSFTTNQKDALENADILWVCFDTPVDENDVPDSAFVLDRIERCLSDLNPGATVLISSQLPAGTCRQLKKKHIDQGLSFACSPENLRLGKALEIFRNPDRVVVGVQNGQARGILEKLFAPFAGDRVIWMRAESV